MDRETAEERTVVVIGASSGIGAATARVFAREGWSVLLAARRADRLRAVAEELSGGAPVHTAVLDVTSGPSVDAFAAGLDSEIDALVYCAGLAIGSDRVADLDADEFDTVLRTNVIGLARVVRAVSGRLRPGPRTTVAVVTSMSGHAVYPGGGSYVSAKHAQVALTETLRQELQPGGTRVVEISPGATATGFALVKARGDTAAAGKANPAVVPLDPEDVAGCVLWAVDRPERMDVRSISVAPRLRD